MTTALLILAVVFTGLMMFGVPVSFSIGIATLLALFTVTPTPDTALIVSAQRVASSLDSFTLVAIPLFILAGGLMNTGGIAMRLIDLAKVLVAWLFGANLGGRQRIVWCYLRLGCGQCSVRGGDAVAAAAPGGLQHAHLCSRQRGFVAVWPADSAVGRADCLFADLRRHAC